MLLLTEFEDDLRYVYTCARTHTQSAKIAKVNWLEAGKTFRFKQVSV